MSHIAVVTNLSALNAHRQLGQVGNKQTVAARRLASGHRINSAADDAAGLAISEKMRGQIRGLDQNTNNIQDGINLIQTAEGAIATINEMVIRIRELVIQASNDTYVHDPSNMTQSDRLQIQREINQLVSEIDAVATRTEFNTRTLLEGRFSQFERFVIEEIITRLDPPISMSTQFPLLSALPYNTVCNSQWFNFIDKPSLRASATMSLQGIDLNAPASEQLHGRSVMVGGAQFNFINAGATIDGLAGVAITIPPVISVRDFLVSLSDPSPTANASSPTPHADPGITEFRGVVNEVTVTPGGQVQFRAPLGTRAEPIVADGRSRPWLFETGEHANTVAITTDNQPNLRLVDGTIGTNDVGVTNNVAPSVTTSGDFTFTLPNPLTPTNAAALRSDSGFRVEAPGLPLPSPFDVSFALVGGARTIAVTDTMTTAELETAIMDFLDTLPGFNPINRAAITPTPAGGGAFTIPVTWNSPTPPAQLPNPAIELTNTTSPGISAPRHGWNASFTTGTTTGISVTASPTPSVGNPFEDPFYRTITIPTVPVGSLPAAFFIGNTPVVVRVTGDTTLGLGAPAAPTHWYYSGATSADQTPGEGRPNPDTPNLQIQNPNGGTWVNVQPGHFINVPPNATPEEIQALITSRVNANVLAPAFGDRSQPEPGQINLYAQPGGTISVPTFTPATQIRNGFAAIPYYEGGRVAQIPNPSIVNPAGNMSSNATYNIGFNLTLANDGSGNINFAYPGGLNHTGFQIGNHTFEFFVTDGTTPRRNAISTTNVTHIDINSTMSADAVRAAMQAAIANIFPHDPDNYPHNEITVTGAGAAVRVNMMRTHNNVTLPTSGTPNPPDHGITARNGHWRFNGLIADDTTFSNGQPAPRPQTRVNFATLNSLLDLIPPSPEPGVPAPLQGFTFWCPSCPSEAFSIIFVADDVPPDEMPDDVFTFDDNGTPVTVRNYIVTVNAVAFGFNPDMTEVAAQIAAQLAAQMDHFTTVRAEGTELVFEDIRRGNLPGADGVTPDAPGNPPLRGRLEPRIFSGIRADRTQDVHDPVGLWIQKGPNLGQGMNIYIEAMNAAALGIADIRGNPTINVMKEHGYDIQPAIETLDEALAIAVGQRTSLGAMQNRLEFAAENVAVANENLTQARSRIMDADMALENMRFVQSNVLNQAAVSMLSQANQKPDRVLQLLQT
ncbi:MAG: hypothetical protein FWC16_00305 [Defluviitaleaceae bacterium]|nr:hypothetical protein [Defluviitaleaceae bacterium]MCL2273344.1 hypothetical protein [Defluviitaleaceae bacterium]